MPPFIVTLAGMFLARGAAFLLSTESIPIDNPLYAALDDHALRLPGGGRLGVVAVLMLAVFAIGGMVLRYTRFGMGVRALGGNRHAAGLMGLKAGRLTIGVYVLSSTLAGLAGVAFSLYTSSGYSLSAVGVELDSIAAVVIGGTLLSGGAGSVLGTFVGVLIQGLILTYINFDGTLSSWWAKIATGLLLFAFITFQQVSTQLHAAPGGRRAMTEMLRFPARRTRSNHAEVARAIGTSIVSGDFPPGSKLPGDAALTERFGISRPVLREGIKTLAAKGLLSSKARVGTVVVERSRWNMFDPDVLTWHLEAGASASISCAIWPKSAWRWSRRQRRWRRSGGSKLDVIALQASLRQMAEAASDTPAFAEADLALHLAVAGASGNQVHVFGRCGDRGGVAGLVPPQRPHGAR